MLSEGLALGFMVAPFAGAWIEILDLDETPPPPTCRSLRGSVD